VLQEADASEARAVLQSTSDAKTPKGRTACLLVGTGLA